MSAIGTSIDRIRTELAASGRLRAGVWSIIAILLGYWVFAPHAARVDQAAADYAAEHARLVRARELLAREDWQQRLDEAAGAEVRLAERFWQAANEGLAQAQVRTALEDMARQVRLALRIDVGLSQPVPGVADLWQVQVQISGTAGLEGALRLVYAIARHPRLLVEERLTFNRVRTGRGEEVRIDGLLSAYFRLAGDDLAVRGLVPSRAEPTTERRFGRPQGSPLRAGAGTRLAGNGRVPSRLGPVGEGLVPSRAEPTTALRFGRPQGSPLRVGAGTRLAGNGRVPPRLGPVGEGLVPSRAEPTSVRRIGRPQGSPLRGRAEPTTTLRFGRPQGSPLRVRAGTRLVGDRVRAGTHLVGEGLQHGSTQQDGPHA